MKNICLCMLICCTLFSSAFGQKYPFPQNVKYPFGVMPTGISNDFVKNWYDSWKKKYLQECSGNVRPGVDPLDKSLVEAQGFSMVAVAYMGDRATFDKLYAYYKSKCTSQGCGLMGWKQTCSGFVDQGSATDGDVDVACALVVANWQWPDSGYDTKAKEVIGNLKKVVAKCGSGYALAGGCAGGSAWGGCDVTDISYYSPAFFRYFAKLSGDNMWENLADYTSTIRDAGANATTGLVPDWQSASGSPGPGGRKGYYSFDAIRAPYKQTLDYLWNGNEKTLAWAKKISTWAYGIGVKNIKDGFELNGSAQSSNHNMAATGSLAVAAMANTQEIADAFAAEVIKLSDDYWYSGYLGNLYLLALTGNIWNPDLIGKVKKISSVNLSGVAPVHVQIKSIAHKGLVVSGIAKAYTVCITDLSGRTTMTNATANSSKLSIDTSRLPAGCYLLQVLDTRQTVVARKMVSLVR